MTIPWPRRIAAALFALALAGLVALSLRPRREPPIPVQTTAVRKGSITRKVTAAGKLQAATQVKISSNLSGDLLELRVKEGDRVRKGDLIARLDARRYAAAVRQQEAARASAAADLAMERVNLGRLGQELARVERLVATGTASQAEVERAQADLDAQQARAQAVRQRVEQVAAALAEARHLLSLTTLYAPIEGVVTTCSKRVGERVRGSDFSEDVIVVISTLAAMEVKVEVGEHEVVYLHDGDKAEIEIDAFPDRKWPAATVEIAKDANIRNPGTEAEVTTFPVRLALTEPVPGALPGMSAQATISTDRHDQALVVPIQAVTSRTERELSRDGGAPPPVVEARLGQPAGAKRSREPARNVVFVVEGGVARARRVETGLADENEIEIVAGLKEGEAVVEGPYRVLSRDLADGKRVRVEGPPAADPHGARGT